MMGSPTALADLQTERMLAAAASQHGLYIPSGALWGGEDIRKMAGIVTNFVAPKSTHTFDLFSMKV